MRTITRVALLPALLVLAGCGARNPNAPARVNGTVTYHGQPVRAGIIVFHSKGSKFSATLGADGSYGIFDVPTGDMIVTVDTESANPAKNRSNDPQAKMIQAQQSEYLKRFNVGAKAPAQPGATASAENYVKIPSKYSDPAKSPLTATLSGGDNSSTDFELKD